MSRVGRTTWLLSSGEFTSLPASQRLAQRRNENLHHRRDVAGVWDATCAWRGGIVVATP